MKKWKDERNLKKLEGERVVRKAGKEKGRKKRKTGKKDGGKELKNKPTRKSGRTKDRKNEKKRRRRWNLLSAEKATLRTSLV